MTADPTIPPREADPARQMFDPALGREPGRGRMEGRRVLVVGAGQLAIDEPDPPVGNASAIARVLAREGAEVVCLDVSRDAADLVVRQIAQDGGRAHPLVADVRDVAAIPGLVAEASRLMGGLDGLVLAVGIISDSFSTMTLENWEIVFQVNVRSHMWFGKAALEQMAPGGAMVILSSRAGLQAGSHMPAYDVTKGAQAQMTRMLALEGQDKGIRCNCVVVGPMDTPLGRSEGKKRPNRAARVAFGRQGTGWEVAYATLFFLSRESSYVNAQSLVVDGGAIYGVSR